MQWYFWETERTVRINITARAKQVEQIDRLAGKAGMTRSAYMVQSSLKSLALAGSSFFWKTPTEEKGTQLRRSGKPASIGRGPGPPAGLKLPQPNVAKAATLRWGTLLPLHFTFTVSICAPATT
jgi:hypothetical protein